MSILLYFFTNTYYGI
ncbi:hypothetical protein CGLO_14589 [Colletotrichum gloeosporioides Cg-14]|uniref:Uncharacterized protein n=1 Tax=Colletotrichum gloeosporioides (strain Cg-14) TaxID=1237896 RepID=T0LDF4_COLGC|nr:hypothetical protein CGLO_14589 [Colletotrichum gloeosporioides Cg-14]